MNIDDILVFTWACFPTWGISQAINRTFSEGGRRIVDDGMVTLLETEIEPTPGTLGSCTNFGLHISLQKCFTSCVATTQKT